MNRADYLLGIEMWNSGFWYQTLGCLSEYKYHTYNNLAFLLLRLFDLNTFLFDYASMSFIHVCFNAYASSDWADFMFLI